MVATMAVAATLIATIATGLTVQTLSAKVVTHQTA
jgi:hypothetical protein